jgi:pilus assembly protein CpaB
MKGKTLIPLIVGLAVGVFAIKLTFDFVSKARASAGSSGEMVGVIRTRIEIPMAAEITGSMLEVAQVPAVLAPSQAFASPEELAGRVSMVIIPKGVPVVPSMLAPVGTKPGMESRIPEGYRAVAVKIDESSAVAYLVKPGSRVDVVAVMNVRRDRKTETISKTILQNVEVAAVGQELGDSADTGALPSKSVTLLVKPEDVPRLHLAAQKGKILLAMRNQTDMSARRAAGTTEKKLLGEETDNLSPEADAQKAGLLARLFGKKEHSASEKQGGVPTAARLARFEQPIGEWKVEVISGSEVKEVTFDSVKATRRADPSGVGRSLSGRMLSRPLDRSSAADDGGGGPSEPVEDEGPDPGSSTEAIE